MPPCGWWVVVWRLPERLRVSAAGSGVATLVCVVSRGWYPWGGVRPLTCLPMPTVPCRYRCLHTCPL